MQKQIPVAVLDLTTWTRLAEVVAYASQRSVTVDVAIRELVNAALSYRLDERV